MVFLSLNYDLTHNLNDNLTIKNTAFVLLAIGGKYLTLPIIELKDVSFKYNQAERNALNQINLSINAGEWIAVIGPNGSGKSTLAKLMNGLQIPNQGQVLINQQELNHDTVWDVRRLIGMVFQNPDNQFVGATVEDDVAFGLENMGIEREEMIQRVHESLEQVRMLSHLKKEPARLSGGQKQRVAIASVLALKPGVIILDEATSMLDPLGRQELIEAIAELKQQYNLTVISITHDINEAAKADRIFVLKAGHLMYEGTPEEIFHYGEQLIDFGLDVPFAVQLMKELENRGVTVPEDYLSEEELLRWISTSYLTK